MLFYFLTRPVAATSRRHLRPRPVDFVILLLDPWLLLAGDISVLARLILLFHFTQPVAVTGRRKLHHRPVELFFHFPYQHVVASRRPVDFTLPC